MANVGVFHLHAGSILCSEDSNSDDDDDDVDDNKQCRRTTRRKHWRFRAFVLILCEDGRTKQKEC
jgi:hypothetical protein